MTPEQKLRRRHEVGRAALAEAGTDPDVLSLHDGRIWISRSVPAEMAWRAFTIMRLVEAPVGPCCLACFLAYRATDEREIVHACDGAPFALDCGRDPYGEAS